MGLVPAVCPSGTPVSDGVFMAGGGKQGKVASVRSVQLVEGLLMAVWSVRAKLLRGG